MKVLITGGTGNLAEYLIKQLEGKHELVLFDRVRPGEGRFPYVTSHTFVAGDLTSGEDCAAAMAGCEAVVHLGAIPWATDSPDYEERFRALGRPIQPYNETMRVNTMGTYELMRAAVQAGVKVVVAATSNCILGHGGRLSGTPFPIEYLPIDEEHPGDVEDTYSLSKLIQEEIIFAASRASGIRAYAIRPAGIQRPERQQEYARSVQPVQAWSDWMWAYADVADLARAFRMCLEAYRDLPPRDAYFINQADTTALEDSLELVKKFRPDLLGRVRGLPGRASFISAEKAGRAFGWKPETSWTRFR